MYLLTSTKINISVISIGISEDHYGSILRTEIGALLAGEKFTSSTKHSGLLLLASSVVNLALFSWQSQVSFPFLFL